MALIGVSYANLANVGSIIHELVSLIIAIGGTVTVIHQFMLFRNRQASPTKARKRRRG